MPTTLAIARWIRNLSPRAEVTLVTLLCFGVAIVLSTAYFVRGRTPQLTNVRTAGSLLMELVFGGAAAAILYLRGWRRSDFPLRLSFENTIAGALVAAAYIAFGSMASLFVTRFAPALRPSPAQRVHHSAVFALTLVFLLVNSLYEELFVNAYFVQALERLGVRHAILSSAALRAVYHGYQGLLAPLVIFILGIVLAAIYLRRRDLGIPFVAHTMVNVTAVLLFASNGR